MNAIDHVWERAANEEKYYCQQIGRQLDRPLVAPAIICQAADELTDTLKKDVTLVVDESLANIHWIRKKLANRELLLF